jgi:uncharacterized SAM-binding protein YcdF (DUF218 family)
MKFFRKSIKIVLLIFGFLFLLMVTLSLTTAPFHAWYRLGKKSAGIHRPPEYIVVMGGGGMPSESGLIRCWYAAEVARHFSRARLIIALPGDTADSASSIAGMKKELILRGIAPERILSEDSGTNTRSQALNIRKLLTHTHFSLPRYLTTSLLLISSPEHIHRAVLTFKKAGFSRVDGQPAWERTIESDLEFKGKKLGGRRFIPEIGDNLAVRYNFWAQMNYEMLVLREWAALAYYKMKGWI